MEFWIKQGVITLVYLVIGASTYKFLPNGYAEITRGFLTAAFVWIMNNVVSKDYQNKLNKELKDFEVSLCAKNFKYTEELESYKKIRKTVNLIEKRLVDTFSEKIDSDPMDKQDNFVKIEELREVIEKIYEEITKIKGFCDNKVYLDTENIIIETQLLLNKYECYLTGFLNYVSTEMSTDEYDKIMEGYYEMFQAIEAGKMEKPMPEINKKYKDEIEKIKKNITNVRENIDKLIDTMSKS